MRIKNASHVSVVAIGWVLGLVLVAMLSPPPDLGSHPTSGVMKGILAFLAIWTVYTAVAVPLYFYRAWRRVRTVPNKAQYTLWIGFETLCAVALSGGVVYDVLLHR